MTIQIVEAHLRVDGRWDLMLNPGGGWSSSGWVDTTINYKHTHNFLVIARLYVYAVDLKKPTERAEKQISKYIMEKS